MIYRWFPPFIDDHYIIINTIIYLNRSAQAFVQGRGQLRFAQRSELPEAGMRMWFYHVLPCFTRILKHKHQAWWKIQAADYYRTRDDPSNAIWIHGFNRDTWWPRALRIWSMNGRHAICQRSVCCRRNLLWKRRDKYLPAATYPASASVANAWICSPPFQARIFGYLWGCTGLVLYPAISSFRMRACTNACVLFYIVLHCFTLYIVCWLLTLEMLNFIGWVPYTCWATAAASASETADPDSQMLLLYVAAVFAVVVPQTFT